jgi:zinc protease
MTKLYRRRVLITALLLALTLSSTRFAFAQATEFTLENGLRLITVESHQVPIVAVDVWVKAGTRREKPDEVGVAHYLEHLLFKGTATHPDEESVDGAIEDLGGSLDAATSYDWAHFYTEVPSIGCNQAIALLADILQHASLTGASVDDERSIILDEINRDGDDPLTSLTDTARALIYAPGSAYSRPITGTIDQVRAITRDQIASFYDKFYVPNNITVVVSGDFSESDVQKDVVDDFGSWRKSDNLPLDDSTTRSAYQTHSTDGPSVQKNLSTQDANESYVVFAFSAPSVSDKPDAWDMDVLLTLLGQGGNNRLTTALKLKNHLVSSIAADYLTQKDPGILTISASMPTSNVDEVQSAVLNQVQLLRNNLVTTSELVAAKSALRANYLFDVDTDSGHADSLGFYDSIDSYHYDVDYLSNIYSVTAEDVQRTAQKYLDPNAYTIVLRVPEPDVTTANGLVSKWPTTNELNAQ